MENNISFTGIKNLYTGKKIYSTLGSYLNHDGRLGQGKKYYEEYNIRGLLTNDENGNHLTEFVKALDKSAKSYQARCVLQNFRGVIDLKVKRFEVKDEDVPITNSNFTLNEVAILPNERSVLPLFTYLAKLTRELKGMPEMSENRKLLVEKANQSIHEESVRFIENMY